MQASTATRLAPYQQHGPLPVLLVGLTVVTRVVDAVSYIALGHVFVANMTEAKRIGASVPPRGRGGPHGRTLATGAGLDPTLERYGLLVGELGLLLETCTARHAGGASGRSSSIGGTMCAATRRCRERRPGQGAA